MICSAAAALLAFMAAELASAASLKDVKHIVLFMQENRSFDHYFGTMAGVRGFGDPNVQINPDGLSTFEQPLKTTIFGTDILKPWYLNHLGGHWKNTTQCAPAGNNSWTPSHTAYNGGLGNNWTLTDYGHTMGYFKREDLSTQFDIAEGWTVLDMSFQSVFASTCPNRAVWMSGTINAPGSPSNPDGKGGLLVDNAATPGCEAEGLNCFPYAWKTFPEYLDEAGISWKFWQDIDNFEDNMLAYFEQYFDAPRGSSLRSKGNSYPGLEAFYNRAANGTLPQISWIIGPQELSEHGPNRPVDGAWLQKKVVDAVTKSPAYKNTILIMSYDEAGGWVDHVVPEVSPKGTPGEWIDDPYGDFGNIPTGPGWRVPRYIISPWTRGGNVFTERSDHTSDIMFIEQWAKAHGYSGVHSEEITKWRRDHMSNLVNAFDFQQTDTSVPSIAEVPVPEILENASDRLGKPTLGALSGRYVGPARCLADYPSPFAPIPYGWTNAHQNMSSLVEDGFKSVRGRLTEGRYLTFEASGLTLTNANSSSVSMSAATTDHSDIRQRWIIHSVGNKTATFLLQSALDGKYIGRRPKAGSMVEGADDAQSFTITYHANGTSYTIQPDQYSHSKPILRAKSRFRTHTHTGNSSAIEWGADRSHFKIFSVSYSK